MKTKTLPKTFEERMERLQYIVAHMEKGDIPLEESVNLYKEGMQLSKACRGQLEKAKHEIQVMTEQGLENFAFDATYETEGGA